ncbi:MAG: hypothetical protein RTU30_03685 [Candidatus Thorarchaeota archaeon]
MEEQLRDMLKHGRKWERLRITDGGIFIRKIPQSKSEPAYLALEINPTDERGIPINKMGVIIRDLNELDAIRALLSQEKVDEVLQVIEKVHATPK